MHGPIASDSLLRAYFGIGSYEALPETELRLYFSKTVPSKPRLSAVGMSSSYA